MAMAAGWRGWRVLIVLGAMPRTGGGGRCTVQQAIAEQALRPGQAAALRMRCTRRADRRYRRSAARSAGADGRARADGDGRSRARPAGRTMQPSASGLAVAMRAAAQAQIGSQYQLRRGRAATALPPQSCRAVARRSPRCAGLECLGPGPWRRRGAARALPADAGRGPRAPRGRCRLHARSARIQPARAARGICLSVQGEFAAAIAQVPNAATRRRRWRQRAGAGGRKPPAPTTTIAGPLRRGDLYDRPARAAPRAPPGREHYRSAPGDRSGRHAGLGQRRQCAPYEQARHILALARAR